MDQDSRPDRSTRQVIARRFGWVALGALVVGVLLGPAVLGTSASQGTNATVTTTTATTTTATQTQFLTTTVTPTVTKTAITTTTTGLCTPVAGPIQRAASPDTSTTTDTTVTETTTVTQTTNTTVTLTATAPASTTTTTSTATVCSTPTTTSTSTSSSSSSSANPPQQTFLIGITKSASPSAVAAGGTVVYTFVVTNLTSLPLSGVTVTDDHCAPVTYVSGDTNSDGVLQATEAWTYTCSAVVNTTTTDTATASGFENGTLTTATASATVDVTTPPATPTPSAVTLTDLIAPGVNHGTSGFGTSSVVVRPGGYVSILVTTDPSLAGRTITFWTRSKTGQFAPLTSRIVDTDGSVHFFLRIHSWTAIWARFGGDSTFQAADGHGRIATVK